MVSGVRKEAENDQSEERVSVLYRFAHKNIAIALEIYVNAEDILWKRQHKRF